MVKWLAVISVFMLFMFFAVPVHAQENGVQTIAAPVFGSVGVGLAILGAGLGIGRIGGSACEAMARQPDMAGRIQTAMIIAAALIEGATFFALILCLLIR